MNTTLKLVISQMPENCICKDPKAIQEIASFATSNFWHIFMIFQSSATPLVRFTLKNHQILKK